MNCQFWTGTEIRIRLAPGRVPENLLQDIEEPQNRHETDGRPE